MNIRYLLLVLVPLLAQMGCDGGAPTSAAPPNTKQIEKEKMKPNAPAAGGRGDKKG